jgi:hypothetical protein
VLHRVVREHLQTFLWELDRQNEERGASGHRGGRTGTVTVIQRFGGALNLNVHFHTLVVDGVFVREPNGSLRFVAAKAPTDLEVEALLGVTRRRVLRLLVRRGLLCEEPAESFDESEAPPLVRACASTPRARRRLGLLTALASGVEPWDRCVLLVLVAASAALGGATECPDGVCLPVS